MTVGPNVTGWEELNEGSMIQSALTMFNTDLGGWVVGALFLLFHFMLYMKTRNLTLCIVVSFLFVLIGWTYLLPWSKVIVVTVLACEMGYLFVKWVFE
jgi:hypothetical protein